MQRQRPTVVLVMAILNFVFAAIHIFSLICGGLGLLLMVSLFKSLPPPPKGTPDPTTIVTGMFQAIPGFIPYTIVTSVLGFAASIVLIIAGIGLIRMRPWARWTCVGYSVYAILGVIVGLVYTLTVVNPAVQKWQEDFIRQQGGVMPPSNAFSNLGGSMFGVVFGLAFPIALLVVMLLPHVSAAFAGKSLPPTASDMPDDYREGQLPRAGGAYDDSYRAGEPRKWN